MKTFQEAEKYLYSLVPAESQKYPGGTGLKRMELLLNELDNPQDFFQSVHITGTSGKGSTSYMLESILREAGYTTGLHISPHVVSIKERMQVGGALVGDTEFVHLTSQVKDAIEKVNGLGLGNVTFFEAVVAMSFEYFRQKGVDIAVIETGMGGTFDGTNVIQSIISIMTPISFDHIEILGHTLAEIADQKAGIIKETNRVVISARQDAEVFDVLKKRAREKGTIILTEGEHFNVVVTDANKKSTFFEYKIEKSESAVMSLTAHNNDGISRVECGLLGEHQARNAGLAITAALELIDAGYEITETQIKAGLEKVKVPGRLEVIAVGGNQGSQADHEFDENKTSLTDHSKIIILDGAHNEEKMKALTEALTHIWKGEMFTCIFACKRKKDARAMIKYLAPISREIIITKFTQASDLGENLAMNPEDIKKICMENGDVNSIFVNNEPAKALERALQEAKTHKNIILVTGSLFLVSEIRKLITDNYK